MMHKVESMAYAIKEPWHGLGNKVDENLDEEQMLAAAGLNWPVHCLPARFKLRDTTYETTEVKILCREYGGETQVMGPAGPAYVPVQNKDMMSFFRGFTKDAGVILDTAGSLDDGRYVWALARFQDGWQMMDEKFQNYLLIVSPHIWGRSLKIFFTPVRVVCFNTMTMALRGGAVDKLKYRHLHNSEFDQTVIAQAQQVMQLSTKHAHAFATTAQLLAKTKADDAASAKFFSKLFMPALATATTEEQLANGQIQSWMGVRDSQVGGDTEAAKGTYWGLVNAVTYTFDHVRGNDSGNRLESAWLGTGASKKLEALELAREMALIEV